MIKDWAGRETSPVPARVLLSAWLVGQWPQDRVVIAAAIAALFGRSAAIRRIQAVPGHGADAWVREGRLAIQRSHAMAAPLIGQSRARGEGNR